MVDHPGPDLFQGLTGRFGVVDERGECFAHRAVEFFCGYSDCLVDCHACGRPLPFRNHAAALAVIARLPDRAVCVHAREHLGEVVRRRRFAYITPPAQRRGARLDAVVVLGGEHHDG